MRCYELLGQVRQWTLRTFPVCKRVYDLRVDGHTDGTITFHSEAAGSAPMAGDRKCYQLPPFAKGLARRAIVGFFDNEII
jgi:hypothetical protein